MIGSCLISCLVGRLFTSHVVGLDTNSINFHSNNCNSTIFQLLSFTSRYLFLELLYSFTSISNNSYSFSQYLILSPVLNHSSLTHAFICD
ncbi:MAG: hypothetical protein WCG25_07185, partial [bacterium]